jgi:hypothetical protein
VGVISGELKVALKPRDYREQGNRWFKSTSLRLLHQIHRTLDVGEEGGHRLALLVWGVSQRPFGRYAKRAIGSSVIFRRSGARRRPGLERVPALSTEFEGRRILESTLGAAAGKGRGAIPANFMPSGFSNPHFEQDCTLQIYVDFWPPPIAVKSRRARGFVEGVVNRRD